MLRHFNFLAERKDVSEHTVGQFHCDVAYVNLSHKSIFLPVIVVNARVQPFHALLHSLAKGYVQRSARVIRSLSCKITKVFRFYQINRAKCNAKSSFYINNERIGRYYHCNIAILSVHQHLIIIGKIPQLFINNLLLYSDEIT